MSIREKARAWLEEHPDEGYQYDECYLFFTTLTRSELLNLMKALAKPTPTEGQE